MVFSVSRLSASCASGDLEGKTNDDTRVMKERLDRRSVVVCYETLSMSELLTPSPLY